MICGFDSSAEFRRHRDIDHQTTMTLLLTIFFETNVCQSAHNIKLNNYTKWQFHTAAAIRTVKSISLAKRFITRKKGGLSIFDNEPFNFPFRRKNQRKSKCVSKVVCLIMRRKCKFSKGIGN